MRILAVDTSSSVAAVAVLDGSKLAGEYLLDHKKNHSQKFMPMIDEILKSLELKPADIDVFAAGIGPGSFTGLRIGVTTIKAMAVAAKKPVVSIPTLDSLAYNLYPFAEFVCPIMDARNNQVYTAVYKQDESGQTKLTEYLGIPVSELVELIKGKNIKAAFLGDAAPMHHDYLKKELGDNCSFAPAGLMTQKASSVAQLAMLRAAKGELESCFDMVPFYLRKSQAEREYDKKNPGV